MSKTTFEVPVAIHRSGKIYFPTMMGAVRREDKFEAHYELHVRLKSYGVEMKDYYIQWKEVTFLDFETLDTSFEVMTKHVDFLKLSVRSKKCLKRAGIEYIYQLVKYREMELLMISGFGRKLLKEVKEALDKYDLSLIYP